MQGATCPQLVMLLGCVFGAHHPPYEARYDSSLHCCPSGVGDDGGGACHCPSCRCQQQRCRRDWAVSAAPDDTVLVLCEDIVVLYPTVARCLVGAPCEAFRVERFLVWCLSMLTITVILESAVGLHFSNTQEKSELGNLLEVIKELF
jgi:hypothetical protein